MNFKHVIPDKLALGGELRGHKSGAVMSHKFDLLLLSSSPCGGLHFCPVHRVEGYMEGRRRNGVD